MEKYKYSLEKALNVFIEEVEKNNSSLNKELEICKTERDLYKKLLEEKEWIQDNLTLYVLELTLKCYPNRRICIGIFTLESLALQAMLHGLKKKNSRIDLKCFDIYKIVLKTPYTKDSEFRVLEIEEEEEDEYICGIKVDNQVYSILKYEQDFDYVSEKINLNEVNDEYFNSLL
jgi:hypothetical protein